MPSPQRGEGTNGHCSNPFAIPSVRAPGHLNQTRAKDFLSWGFRTQSGIAMRFGKTSARQAAECRWLAASLGALFAVSLAAPASASVLITIDKSTQQMSVAVDGVQRYIWPDRAARQ